MKLNSKDKNRRKLTANETMIIYDISALIIKINELIIKGHQNGIDCRIKTFTGDHVRVDGTIDADYFV